MIYNLANEIELEIFNRHIKSLRENKKIVEIKEVKKKRTNQQNRAMHLYFTFISRELNNLGQTFVYTGISGKQFETPFTPELVKSFIIKPLIKTLFDYDSTTKLTTSDINRVIDILTNFFSQRGINIIFPNIENIVLMYNLE